MRGAGARRVAGCAAEHAAGLRPCLVEDVDDAGNGDGVRGKREAEPAEGSDEVTPPTQDSPQTTEASAESGESSEEPAEGAAEETKA